MEALNGPGRRAMVVLAWAGLVAVGGAVGTTVRAALEVAFPIVPGAIPWTTLGINLIGSFVLGMLLEALTRTGYDQGWRKAVRLGCGTGVIGGFTTYSTFVVEIERLLAGGALVHGLAYALSSLVLGMAAATAGIALAGRRASQNGSTEAAA